ncbi:MAG: hypothetical protein QG564_1801 [Campylobacterota bacterium]|nr:hypothetical protein [Campylobacterota bacterium]
MTGLKIIFMFINLVFFVGSIANMIEKNDINFSNFTFFLVFMFNLIMFFVIINEEE